MKGLEMKKGFNVRVMMVGVLMMMLVLLTGCGGNAAAASDQADFTVGISSTMPHPAMDDASEGFREQLTRLMNDAGYSVDFLYQNADGVAADMAGNASLLVSQGVDLLYGLGTGAAVGARDVAQAANLPLVFAAVNNPVAVGLDVEHATGASNLLDPVDQMNYVRKVMGVNDDEVLNVAYLYYTAEDNSRLLAHGVRDAFVGSETMRVTLFPFNSLEELTPQFTALRAGNFDVVYVGLDNLLITHRAQLRSLNEQGNPLPMVGAINAMADMEGGMVAGLSVNFVERGKTAAQHAFDILVNGKSPSDLPISFPTSETLEAKVNLERARLIGFELPQAVVDGADVVVASTQ